MSCVGRGHRQPALLSSPQPSSSEASPQSGCPSHRKASCTHSPLSQANVSSGHSGGAGSAGGRWRDVRTGPSRRLATPGWAGRPQVTEPDPPLLRHPLRGCCCPGQRGCCRAGPAALGPGPGPAPQRAHPAVAQARPAHCGPTAAALTAAPARLERFAVASPAAPAPPRHSLQSSSSDMSRQSGRRSQRNSLATHSPLRQANSSSVQGRVSGGTESHAEDQDRHRARREAGGAHSTLAPALPACTAAQVGRCSTA